MLIRIIKKYTAICRNRPPTHTESRFGEENLFNFYKKYDKLFHDVPRVGGMNDIAIPSLANTMASDSQQSSQLSPRAAPPAVCPKSE